MWTVRDLVNLFELLNLPSGLTAIEACVGMENHGLALFLLLPACNSRELKNTMLVVLVASPAEVTLLGEKDCA